MKKRWYWSVVALLLVAALLLPGCESFAEYNLMAILRKGLERAAPKDAFSEMEYTRPDLDAYQRLVDESCQLAATSRSADQMLDQTWEIYAAYDTFYTMKNLADIRYSLDLSDPFYQEEFNYCSVQSAVVDEGLDTYYRALAKSPIVKELEDSYFDEGFFDGYGEDTPTVWNEAFSKSLEEESTDISAFYTQMQELGEGAPGQSLSAAEAEQLGELFVDLIRTRRQIAEAAGYDSYEDFAWDWYYSRDFTPAQAEAYVAEIAEKLAPMYRSMSQSRFWLTAYNGTYGQAQCEAYLSSAAEQMGGLAQTAWDEMQQRQLYDIAPGLHKYEGSFEIYLTDFQAPFVFVNPYGDVTDLLSFAHEFGHFVNDYACGGSYASTDVAEFFSQGMEYLSLCYAQRPTTQDVELVTRLKMADSLSVYVEQAAYYSFERQAYALPDEELSVESLRALYEATGRRYGFDTPGWNTMEWVSITHFYTSPFYVISYVVSNDAAFQLYQLEQEEAGAGLARYEELVQTDEDVSFLTFLEDSGLESPFAPGRLDRVAELLEARVPQ